MYQNCCKKCGSVSLFTEKKGNNIGLYCKDCGAWIKWLGKDELKAFEHSQIEKNKSSLSDKNAIITSWRNILSVLKETGYDYLYQDDITKVADVLREYYGL